MGERKVLNKYFPPDFDPKKLPKDAARQYGKVNIRMMLPFSMCCISCGHYMYQGKKFNSRKEIAKGMDYLGIDRHRFIIKCEVCMNRIAFLTDPKNQDYECESGATRNYSAFREQRLAKQDDLREQEKKQALGEEDEKQDSMQVLENRTLESKREMDDMESLEQIQKQNRKRARLNADCLLKKDEEIRKKMTEKSIEEEVALFSKNKREFNVKQIQNMQKNIQVSTQSTLQIEKDIIQVKKKQKKKLNGKVSSLALLSVYSSSSDEN